MKQLYIQVATQHPKNIEDAFSVKNQSNIGRNSNRLAILNPKQPGGALDTDNREWKGTGLCKGPPGRPRSPGQFPEHPPDNNGGILPDRVSNLVGGNTPRNTEIQFLKNNKFNFYSRLNFTTMKKQILFLAFFILTFTAGLNSAFAQMKQSTIAPTPLNAASCKPSPLNPIAGIPFTYSVSNPNGVAVPTTYTWWATKNPNFINTTTFASDMTDMLTKTPGQLLDASATYGTALGSGNTMTITWSAEILAATKYQGTPSISATPAAPSPTFVVVQADGTCNNNLQVFELNPLPSFTLDIANIDPTNYTTTLPLGETATSCVDKVRSAVYSGGQVLMDYGTNTMTFEVIAANYATSWIPTFQIISGLTTNQTATIGWAYTASDALNGNFIDGSKPAVVGTDVVGTTALLPEAGLDISKGTSIYVRVVISNHQFESIADQPLVLSVDGKDATGKFDIDQASLTCDATENDRKDQATHVITKRPDIQDTTGDGAINNTPDDTFVKSPRP